LEVLELGCGNSPFCEEIYRDGITEITCNDLSAVAVEKMQKRSEAKGYKLEYVLKAKGFASQNRLLLNVVILNLGGNEWQMPPLTVTSYCCGMVSWLYLDLAWRIS
jgi:hypothetical protein